MSTFWSYWIISLTTLSIIGILWILFSNTKVSAPPDSNGEPQTTGHSHDGIEEIDNPLPAWWLYLFVGTIIFSIVYLILFPGMGNYKGVLEWTQEKEWQNQIDKAEQQFSEKYAALNQQSIIELSQNKQAIKMGQRLFANNCAACHGINAEGSFGYPNLADNDWLYGGSPEAIKASITHGRIGSMPAWQNILKYEQTLSIVNYVKNLPATGIAPESDGHKIYKNYCASCHGPTAKGNTALGAPNLTDTIWLYGSSDEDITTSILSGRNGNMPAHKNLISEEKIHLLSAYVYSLSKKEN